MDQKAAKKKKGGVESINGKLALVMKSGKALLGHKSTLKSLRSGKCARLPLGAFPLVPPARPSVRSSLAPCCSFVSTLALFAHRPLLLS
jgi:hypothetical protein